jgi:N-formylglutamate deformylase
MAQFGVGVLYEKNDEGQVIRKLTPELKERILNIIYLLSSLMVFQY